MKSLVADDVSVSRHLLHRILSQYGNCTEVINGKEAVKHFIDAHQNNDPFHLLCLDILMPNKDGLQTLKEIRTYESQNKIAEENRIKIIMTTGIDEDNVVKQAKSKGYDAYLLKPIQIDELIGRIKELGLIE